jgi:acetyl-CoA synthetase
MAGVIGVPDEMRTEAIKAFLVLKPGQTADDALTDQIVAHVRNRLSPHLAPRAVAYVDSLPLTATGKIMRRELKREQEGGG